MAAFTSKAEGNWSASGQTTWNEAGVPGNGDTYTLSHAVTVDANTTVGSSPADQTTMVGTIGANGRLIIAAGVTLTHRGNLYNNAGGSGSPQNGIQLGAGSVLEFDASATTPTTQIYVLKGGQYAKIYAPGTSGSHAIVRSNAGGGNAKFTNESANRGTFFDATYLDFLRIGDASNAAFTTNPDSSTYSTTTSLVNCTLTSCGRTDVTHNHATSVSTLQDCVWVSSLASSCAIVTSKASSSTSSAMLMCSFDKGVSTPNLSGWSITDNYFGGGITANISAATNLAAEFSGNLVLTRTTVMNNFELSPADCYYCQDASVATGVGQWMSLLASQEMSGCIFDNTSTQEGVDLIFPRGATGTTLSFHNNLLLPQAAGKNVGKILSFYDRYTTGTARTDGTTAVVGTGTSWLTNARVGEYFKINSTGTEVRIAAVTDNTHLTLDSAYADSTSAVSYTIDKTSLTQVAINHNTYATQGGNQVEAGVGVGENDIGTAGEITAFKSNLIWTAPSAVADGFKLVRQQSAKQNFVTVANCNYNWGWNLGAGSEGNGYHCWTGYQASALFSDDDTNIDANGGSGDPQFVDATRNLATFDTAATGLNNAAGTAWATSTAYVADDVVSNTDAGFYSGASVNYRCIVGHTSGASTEPGVGASWRTNWELQSAYRIREDRTRIAALLTWVKNGFKVQNASLNNAGHDSATIGACDYQSATIIDRLINGGPINTGLFNGSLSA